MQISPVDTLVCDSARIAVWQSNPDYDYNRELMVPDESLFEMLQRWLGKLLQRLLGSAVAEQYSTYIWIGIFVVILLLLFWFLYKKKPELFMRSGKKSSLYTVEDDTIYGIDFPKAISQMIAVHDYREAIRLLYLQTLKELSDGGRIDWQLYKTPTQYIYEVRIPAFRQLTNHFLRVRYGNFDATETLFEQMQTLQDEIRKGGLV